MVTLKATESAPVRLIELFLGVSAPMYVSKSDRDTEKGGFHDKGVFDVSMSDRDRDYRVSGFGFRSKVFPCAKETQRKRY